MRLQLLYQEADLKRKLSLVLLSSIEIGTVAYLDFVLRKSFVSLPVLLFATVVVGQ